LFRIKDTVQCKTKDMDSEQDTPGSDTRAVLSGRTLPPNNRPPNMAAANFVMTEGCGLNGTAVAAVSID